MAQGTTRTRRSSTAPASAGLPPDLSIRVGSDVPNLLADRLAEMGRAGADRVMDRDRLGPVFALLNEVFGRAPLERPMAPVVQAGRDWLAEHPRLRHLGDVADTIGPWLAGVGGSIPLESRGIPSLTSAMAARQTPAAAGGLGGGLTVGPVRPMGLPSESEKWRQIVEYFLQWRRGTPTP